MIILCKLLGALGGYHLAKFFGGSGFLGCVVGLIFGHSLDIVLQAKFQQFRAKKYWQAKASQQYAEILVNSLFLMLGKLCVVDGAITKEENAAADRVTEEILKMKRKDRKAALQIFRDAGRSQTSFQYDAAQFLEIHKNEPQALENMCLLLFTAAVSDAPLKVEEERLIHSAAHVFGISEERYRTLLSNFAPNANQRSHSREQRAEANGGTTFTGSDQYYAILGCTKTDSPTVIKQKYRKLVSDYHPDKIVSKNLPEEFTKFANEKFKSIQEAYEIVKSERGFS